MPKRVKKALKWMVFFSSILGLLLGSAAFVAWIYVIRPAWGRFRQSAPAEKPLLTVPAAAGDQKEVAWPFGDGEVEIKLGHVPGPRVEALDLLFRLKPYSVERARRGEFSSVVLECRRLLFDGMAFDNVKVNCRDVQIDLARLLGEKEIKFIRVGELRPWGEIGPETVKRFLSKLVPEVHVSSVKLREKVYIKGRALGLPLEAQARLYLSADRARLTVHWENLKAAGVLVPPAFTAFFQDVEFSLEPTPNRPVRILLSGIDIANDLLVVKGRIE